MKKLIITIIAVIIATSLATTAFCDLAIGSNAPDFSLPTTTGERFLLSDTLKGSSNVVVISVWATWCPHCVDEVPYLSNLDKNYKDKNVKVLGISIDSTKNDVLKFIKQKNLKYTVALDPDGNKIGDPYKIEGIPTTYILDKSGKIRYATSGFSNIKSEQIADMKKIENVIQDILKEYAPPVKAPE